MLTIKHTIKNILSNRPKNHDFIPRGPSLIEHQASSSASGELGKKILEHNSQKGRTIHIPSLGIKIKPKNHSKDLE